MAGAAALLLALPQVAHDVVEVLAHKVLHRLQPVEGSLRTLVIDRVSQQSAVSSQQSEVSSQQSAFKIHGLMIWDDKKRGGRG